MDAEEWKHDTDGTWHRKTLLIHAKYCFCRADCVEQLPFDLLKASQKQLC
jgi:hypothetical protein